jgi:hypothetical protein
LRWRRVGRADLELGDGVDLLSPALHGGDLGAGRPVAAPDAAQEQRRHGRLIVRREDQAEPFSRRAVAVDEFPEGEEVVELRGRANRGGSVG